jgi:predicted transcriptional regulator
MKESVTMRLDSELIKFADEYAKEHKTTRTQLVTDILVIFKAEVENDGR